jgi:hypothetical protein
VHRLEALRRAGIVERIAEGVWKVPPDLMQKAQLHDAKKAAGLNVELRSHTSIEHQVRAIGATWLDKQLSSGGAEVAAQGFGVQVNDAIQRRVDFLSEQGLAERRGKRVVLARNLLTALRDRELTTVGKALQGESGLSYRPLRDVERASGVYRQSVQLASGRFAMLEDGVAFSLVPWRSVLEDRLGQHVSAVVRGSAVRFQFGRTIDLGV